MAPVARFGALLLLISCSFASALYDAKSPILQVTDADYKSKLKGFALLELYAPWCGHCKQLAPEWEKLGKTMKSLGVLTVAAADCDAHKAIGAAYNLKGFPTIVATMDGKLVDTYTGGRTAPEIASWGMKLAAKEVSKRLGGKADKSDSSSSSSGGGSASEPGGGKAVAKLTATSFDKEVLRSSAPWMVEFYAPCVPRRQRAHSLTRAQVVRALQAAGARVGARRRRAQAQGRQAGRGGLHRARVAVQQVRRQGLPHHPGVRARQVGRQALRGRPQGV